MRATIIAALAFALTALAGQPSARGDDFEKHMKSYYKHMNEAYEEMREGDMDDYYEELGKAQSEYDKAYRSCPPPAYYGPPCPPPVYYNNDFRPYPRPGPRFGGWGYFGYGRGPCRPW